MKGRENWHAKATGMKAKEREQRKRKMWQGEVDSLANVRGERGRRGGGKKEKRERNEREISSLRVRQFKMDMLISHGVGRQRGQPRSL